MEIARNILRVDEFLMAELKPGKLQAAASAVL
jgi:hypothetical protein